jgi:hypothetical protein
MAETDDESTTPAQDAEAEAGAVEQSQKHDEGYKSILSDTSNFLHLLRKYFASAPWIAELLSANVEAVRIDKSYITKEFRRVDSDLIYKLRKDGADIYFYVLLELQSKVDYTMPFRLLRYMVELLNDISRTRIRIFESARASGSPPSCRWFCMTGIIDGQRPGRIGNIRKTLRFSATIS